MAVVLAFLALAGLVFQQTATSFVEQGAGSGGAMRNAATFPELLAWRLVLLAALQLVQILRGVTAASAVPDTSAPAGAPPAKPGSLTKALICTALRALSLPAEAARLASDDARVHARLLLRARHAAPVTGGPAGARDLARDLLPV